MSGKVAIDLFCGCGGLTEGLKTAGFSVVAAVDLDRVALETYKLNHSEVLLYEKDILSLQTKTVLDDLSLRPGDIDLVAGCPPCQGFSKLFTKNGSRNADDDPRNDLLWEYLRFVEELKPRFVMLENVPGMAADSRFVSLCEKLMNLGYLADYRIADASQHGVPQRRKRLILVGRRDRKPGFPPGDEKVKTVREAIGNLPTPGGTGDPAHDLVENRSARIMEMIEAVPRNGGSRSSLPDSFILPCHRKLEGFRDIYGRMAWDRVSPTITTGCFNPSRGRYLHPEQNRAITMREAALLQSFPADYRFPTRGKQVLARLIGNALPPEMIRRHAVVAFDE